MPVHQLTVAVDIADVQTIMTRFGLRTEADAVELALRRVAR